MRKIFLSAALITVASIAFLLAGCPSPLGGPGPAPTQAGARGIGPAQTYTVTYDANGGNGSVPTDSNLYPPGTMVTVLGQSTLSRTGNTFAGWNTQADGSGTTYAVGVSFHIGNSITLYARWTQKPTYKVSYMPHGATGGMVPVDPNNYLPGDNVTVLDNTGGLVKSPDQDVPGDFVFAGWNTAGDGMGSAYVAGNTFLMGTADVKLHAQWAHAYDVIYMKNGASGGNVPVDGQEYLSNATVTVLDNTSGLYKSGFVFSGWNTSRDGTGSAYAAGSTFLMGNYKVKLYAQWAVPSTAYKVTYGAPDASGGTPPVDLQLYAPGAKVYVLGNTGQSPLVKGWRCRSARLRLLRVARTGECRVPDFHCNRPNLLHDAELQRHPHRYVVSPLCGEVQRPRHNGKCPT